jgi:predicted ferric reductase
MDSERGFIRQASPRTSHTSPKGDLMAARKTVGQRLALGNVVLTLLGINGGLAIGMAMLHQPVSDWSDPSLAVTALSRVMAMLGTYFALCCLVLIARVPWLENAIGQDRLVKWHRTLAPYSLYLILGHVLLVSLGYSVLDQINAWNELWRLILITGWMMPAFVGFVFMMMVGVTSYKRARSKMRYETWWLLHLYSYLGIALAFGHQITSSQFFATNDKARYWWVAMYLFVIVFIVGFRIAIPLLQSMRHDLRVEKVIKENHDTISIVVRGKDVARLAAQGGQFFAWRFLQSNAWWEAHPYSLSASPRNDRLRITVKNLGDHSGWMKKLKPNTRVLIEGPYGVFTADQVQSKKVALIAGGVGITPIRAIMEELPRGTDIDLIWRASKTDDLILNEEVKELAELHKARIHYMVGSRKQFPMSPGRIRATVPHIAQCDVFMCGPDSMIQQSRAALLSIGVHEDNIHDEAFAY